jgi:hypothetical protein
LQPRFALHQARGVLQQDDEGVVGVFPGDEAAPTERRVGVFVADRLPRRTRARLAADLEPDPIGLLLGPRLGDDARRLRPDDRYLARARPVVVRGGDGEDRDPGDQGDLDC